MDGEHMRIRFLLNMCYSLIYHVASSGAFVSIHGMDHVANRCDPVFANRIRARGIASARSRADILMDTFALAPEDTSEETAQYVSWLLILCRVFCNSLWMISFFMLLQLFQP